MNRFSGNSIKIDFDLKQRLRSSKVNFCSSQAICHFRFSLILRRRDPQRNVDDNMSSLISQEYFVSSSDGCTGQSCFTLDRPQNYTTNKIQHFPHPSEQHLEFPKRSPVQVLPRPSVALPQCLIGNWHILFSRTEGYVLS